MMERNSGKYRGDRQLLGSIDSEDHGLALDEQSQESTSYIGQKVRPQKHEIITTKSYLSRNLLLSEFWQNNNLKQCAAIYENLCEGCGYGVFEAKGKLCDFCRYAVTGRFKESHIYENICDKCSEIYSGTECELCAENVTLTTKQDCSNTNNNKTTTTPRRIDFKPNRLLSGLFGTLKKVRSRDKQQSKYRKLEIVHNVDGYENVFKTNETFDLNRICELKRLNSSATSSSEQHIYGKLRKSDDHLMNSVNIEQNKLLLATNSKSDPILHKIIGTGTEKITNNKRNRITATNSLNRNENKITTDKQPRPSSRLIRLDSVIDWMSSLRQQTYDYNCNVLSTGDSICNTKSIPSRNFSCCGYTYTHIGVSESFHLSGEDSSSSLRSNILVYDLDTKKLVEDFKTKLMERQRIKRKAIYIKNHEIDTTIEGGREGEPSNSLSSSSLPPSSSSSFDSESDSVKVSLIQKKNRQGIYERDSEFVKELLSAFDTFMKRDAEEAHHGTTRPEVLADNAVDIAANNNKELATDETSNVVDDAPTAVIPLEHNESAGTTSTNTNGIECNYSGIITKCLLSESNPSNKVKLKKLHSAITRLMLNKSLNRIILGYDNQLSGFLKNISSHKFVNWNFSELFRMYQLLNSSQCLSVNNKIDKPIIDNEDKFIDRSEKCNQQPPPPIVVHHPPTPPITPPDEDIYQPIWKFQTVGNPRESYASEYYDLTAINDSSTSSNNNVEDHGEWETDDEFKFSRNMKELTVAVAGAAANETTTASETISNTSTSILSINSTTTTNDNDPYRSVCIFYSQKEPKLRAIIYDYDPRQSYFNNCTNNNNNRNNNNNSRYQYHQHDNIRSISNASMCGRHDISRDRDHQRAQNRTTTTKVSAEVDIPKSESCKNIKIMSASKAIPDCVQAWKFSLLAVDYLEDEEEMYIFEDAFMKREVTLQRLKSVSMDNILETPQEKQISMRERFRNKLRMGNIKITNRSPKEKKRNKYMKRPDSTYDDITQTPTAPPKYPIFGVSLNEVEKDILGIPRFVSDCIANIEHNNSIQTDGLYRASGNKVAIDEIKKKLTDNNVYDGTILRNQDVHTVTGLLKLFFRELPSPLIPSQIYNKLPENLPDKSNLPIIKDLLHDIASPSKDTLKYLLKHLTVVAQYSDENRMPAANLAIIWGPCIVLSSSMGPFDIGKANTLTKVLIENYGTIFGNDEILL